MEESGEEAARPVCRRSEVDGLVGGLGKARSRMMRWLAMVRICEVCCKDSAWLKACMFLVTGW
jgi:hypothetical protein